MASLEPFKPKLPFPIPCISSQVERYFLYDVDLVTWLRREHHILGVLMGSLPQAPSQNIFLGLPLELMPEEARLLVEKGLAYIVNDREWHASGSKRLDAGQVRAYQDQLAREGLHAAQSSQKQREMRTEAVMKKLNLGDGSAEGSGVKPKERSGDAPVDSQESLFDSAAVQPAEGVTKRSEPTPRAWAVTPATASSLLPEPAADSLGKLPAVNSSSYAIFKHLHQNDYYTSPGLRFGGQYMAYPGDPLRFHSHFLAVGADWDQELDLIDIVGGGRLGTGVKKGFLLGGVERPCSGSAEGDEGKVRAFSIEWGAM